VTCTVSVPPVQFAAVKRSRPCGAVALAGSASAGMAGAKAGGEPSVQPLMSLVMVTWVLPTGPRNSATSSARGVLGADVPAALLAVAVTVCGPVDRGAAGVKLQAPVAPSAAAVPSEAAPSNTSTVLPGSALPVMAGCAAPVVMLAASSCGAAGADTALRVKSAVVSCTAVDSLPPLKAEGPVPVVWPLRKVRVAV